MTIINPRTTKKEKEVKIKRSLDDITKNLTPYKLEQEIKEIYKHKDFFEKKISF